MNSIKSSRSVFTSSNLRGLVAAVVVVALSGAGMARQAHAADVDSFSFGASNSASSTTDTGHGAGKASPKLAEAVSKVEEIDAMVASLRLQLQTLETACYDLQVLSNEVDAEMSVSSEASAEELAQLEEAQRIFTEQIAMLLDDASITVVSSDLEKKKKDKQMQIESWSFGASNAGMAVSVDPVTEQLAGLKDVFEGFSAACKATGEHIKEAKLFIR